VFRVGNLDPTVKKPVLTCQTLILSDVHLGTFDCKIRQLNQILKHTRCRKIILNGDIIDGWRLQRKGGWTNEHSRFVRLLLKMVEKKNTRIVYLRGNHDDILRRFLPLSFENIEVVEEHVHVVAGRRYLVLHGDVFDVITTRLAFLSRLGAVGYDWLLGFNRFYNRFRRWRGKESFSISKAIKGKVKSAVNFISRFEEQIAALAINRGCSGVICGHIHTPDDKIINGIHYLNSGDWVESLTAIIEHVDGKMEIIRHEEFCRRLGLSLEGEAGGTETAETGRRDWPELTVVS